MSSSEEIWRQATLLASSNIRHAVSNLDRVAIKIILVVNEAGVLQGTVSDGDIRRGLLKGLDLSSPITSIIYRNALVVPPDMNREMVMQLMLSNKIQQIPIVDEHQHIVGLHLWDEINKPLSRSNLMVIMAGGLGTRLHPHTKTCPKPLVTVGDRPILEHIIRRARLDGFTHFVLAIHHLGHMIEEYFGNGDSLGVHIEYLREETPLGTAGALGLLKMIPDAPFLVTNGDVITDMNYGELLGFHMEYSAAATMAMRVHEWQNPFGVIQTQGIEIIGIEEKPIIRSHINAGIYVLNPTTLNVLVANEHCDMPSLFERLRRKGELTAAYPMHESWIDVGRPDDLKLALTAIEKQ